VVKTPPGTAQASVVKTRQDAAQALWCRHLQEQHWPL
jgi:hypothetical protein